MRLKIVLLIVVGSILNSCGDSKSNLQKDLDSKAQEFVYFCENRDQFESAANTVDAILDFTETKNLDCKSAYKKLSEQEMLDLHNFNITDIRPLSGLSKLTTLNLSANNIINFSDMKNLPSLIHLDISQNNLKSIPNLVNISSLIELNLSHNEISDLSGAPNKLDVVGLHLDGNPILDLASLKNMALKLLSLNNMPNLKNFESLENFSSLQHLMISDNSLTEISFLENLDSLKSLIADNNLIDNISILDNLFRLKYLDLGFNNINKISNSQFLPTISTLILSGNPINDISFVQSLEGIRELLLSDMNLKTIDSFGKNFNRLETLHLGGNQIESLPFINTTFNWPSLKYLDISNNKISDFRLFNNLEVNNSIFETFYGNRNLVAKDKCPTSETKTPRAIRNFCLVVNK